MREMQWPTDRSKWLDYAVKAAIVGVLVAAAFFAYTYISTQWRERNSTPAARAVANLTEAVRQSPNSVTARLRLADAMAAAGRIREATEQYEIALDLSPDDPGALAGLAQIAMNQEEWRTAEGYWQRIIDTLSEGEYSSIDQRLEKAYYYMGSTLMELQEYEEAATYLREALRMRNDASDTYFLLAVAYREMDSPEKFRDNLELALQFDPLLPEANYEMGKLLLADGDEAGAAEHFRVSADNAPPDRPEPLDALEELGVAEDRLEAARGSLEAGDTEAALAEARVASALDPDDLESVRIIAQAYDALGRTVEARTGWERVLTLSPGDEEAIAAITRLDAAGQ